MATQSRYCFGIDLGTSYSSICYVNPQGRHPLPYVMVEAVKVPRDRAEFDMSARVPSLVCSAGKALKTGFQAQALWKRGWLWRTLFASVKSDLGACRIYEDADDARVDDPIKIQSSILRLLIDAAKQRTGEDPRNARVVITVPASFEMGQRKDTLRAAELAGLRLEDGDLLDEPNAAFLDLVNSQAIDRLGISEPKNILIFDFGGGTCDVSILRVKKDPEHAPLGLIIENLAISNYERLGGDNLDLHLVHHVFLPAVCRASGIDFAELSERDKRALRWRLKEEARRLKERLCEKARMEFDPAVRRKIKQRWTVDPFPLPDENTSTQSVPGHLAFAEFEGLMEPFFGSLTNPRITLADDYYVGSAFTPALEALARARLSPDQIDFVLLNGGSCRNPLVTRAFKELDIFAHAEVIEANDLDLAVARGAAMNCYYKHCQNYEPITPIVNSDLGLLTHGDHFERLVPAGARLPFPAEGKRARFVDRFSLPKDNLPRVHFAIYAGREGNRSLVQTLTMNLPPQTRRRDLVVVEVHIDANKVMSLVAFLATNPNAPLETKLENPLVRRLPTPQQRRALDFRRRLQDKRAHTPLLRPSADELTDLANLERQAGSPERGLEILQRIEERNRKQGQTLSARAENIYGLCYVALGRARTAIEHFKLATETDPREEVYSSNYGYELMRAGRAEEAIPHLRRAVGLNARHGVGYAMLGEALRQLGQEQEALAEFREAKRVIEEKLRAAPRDAHLLSWIEGVCRSLAEYDEANRYRKRQLDLERAEYLGASPDELVAGLDSGIIPPGELANEDAS